RAALAAGRVVAVDQQAVAEVKRQAFGFSLPSLALFSRGPEPPAVDSVTAEVERAWRNPDGRWMVALKGGAVWRQIDSGDPSHRPAAGAQATVRRAFMGSYMMTVGGPVAIRVHRDN
ncbi:MAG: hypothetical protein JWQ29_952, partial [Phenylobacterium sp.]|nr:hypothetical protein [Phenylobacterium sp.]